MHTGGTTPRASLGGVSTTPSDLKQVFLDFASFGTGVAAQAGAKLEMDTAKFQASA